MIINQTTLNKLQQPISNEKSCGELLKKDRTKYRPLRSIFNQAKTSIKSLTDHPDDTQIDQLREENNTNWVELSESCVKSLMDETKDIELLGWLVTSQLIIDKSFSGFSLSLTLLNTLLTNFWDDINPTPFLDDNLKYDKNEIEDEKIAIRIRFLSQIFGESQGSGLLFIPLRLTIIIGDLTLSEYIKRKADGNIMEEKVTQKKQFNIIKENEEEKIKNINCAIHNINEIRDFTLNKIEGKSITKPDFKQIIQELNYIKEAIIYIADIIENEEVQTINEDNTLHIDSTNLPNTQVQSLHDISDRNHAFSQLRIISNYFKLNEPHSPIAFLLEKSIRWGNLSLPELLEEWFKDGKASLDDMFNLAGLNDTNNKEEKENKK